jgi:hypothetical protein
MLVGLVQRNPTTLVVLRWVTLSLGNSSCIAVPSRIHAVLTQPIVCFIDLLKTESHELHPPLAFAGQHAY